MKLILRGAAKEVGRSCIDITSKHGRFLFDCGIGMRPEGLIYPKELGEMNTVDAVFLSHAHLDHCGALALEEHRGLKAPIFCTEETRELANMLLIDSHKIEEHSFGRASFNEKDIRNVYKSCKIVEYDREYKYRGVPFKYFEAGHIPGAASILAEIEGKKILYSGDFNLTPTRLAPANRLPDENVDILIIETTYGDRNHPPRKTTEQKFLKEIKNTLANSGSVIIPAFAVGRAQEMLLLLKDFETDVPIYIDGMAIEVTKNFFRYSNFVKDKKALRDAFNKSIPIKNWKHRKEAIEEQGIFITTSGMLTGGPVMEYLKHLAKDSNNSILLTGYQAEGTNGRMLLEEGKVNVDGYDLKVHAKYMNFDFSAHAGLDDLKKTVKKINPKKLILNHGDPGSEESFAHWAEQEGFKTYVPTLLKPLNL